VPSDVATALAGGGPAPAGLSEKERAAFDSLDTFFKKYMAYAAMMGTRPQTIGYALTDTPAGLAAWMYDYNNGEPERLLAKDDFLDDVTLYWLTNTAASAARIYWETAGQSVVLAAAQKTADIALPVAISVFPEEVYRAPETWASIRNFSRISVLGPQSSPLEGENEGFARWRPMSCSLAGTRSADDVSHRVD